MTFLAKRFRYSDIPAIEAAGVYAFSIVQVPDRYFSRYILIRVIGPILADSSVQP
jgi:hypothetical protein